MFHERNAMGGGSPYVTGVRHGNVEAPDAADPLVELARDAGRLDDARVQELLGESRVLARTQSALTGRIADGIRRRVVPDTATAITRLMSAEVHMRTVTIALEIAGPRAAARRRGDRLHPGMEFLLRQSSAIGGGTTEMARNNISERVLGMPREYNPYQNVPFRDVPKGPASR
jgi:alkylation response protein AidB-like acyl-CoA dehydrogenase